MDGAKFTPRYMRLALHNAIAAWSEWCPGEPEPQVYVRGQSMPISEVAQRLIGAEGIVPRKWCRRDLGLAPRCSYAHAAEALRRACVARQRPP